MEFGLDMSIKILFWDKDFIARKLFDSDPNSLIKKPGKTNGMLIYDCFGIT